MYTEAFVKGIEYPRYSIPEKVPPPDTDELERRLCKCREKMKERLLSHLVIYADREHFASLHYLVNFDPRFEEALLILLVDGIPLLLVGNEGEGHLGISPLYCSGKLRTECFQTFSLMNQPRKSSRSLSRILSGENIGPDVRVGVVGWKCYHDDDFSSPSTISDVPSYIWDAIVKSAGKDSVENATDIFISPHDGLRTSLSAYEIAQFEFSNVMGSEAMKSLLSEFRAGIVDFELMSSARFSGFPLSCHPSIKSQGNLHYGLSSPTGDIVEKGMPCSVSIAYRGSNICRAGWVAESEKDLPDAAKGYIKDFVSPYLNAMKKWFEMLKIGTTGGELYELIANSLPYEKFGVYLNPGHLIHFDEWVSSPIYEGSSIAIRSGMYIQADIIPRSECYYSTRMEDGFVIADAQLRETLSCEWPEVYGRCMARRAFMESLGFRLSEEVLPLSNMAGIVVPFFLKYTDVMSFV